MPAAMVSQPGFPFDSIGSAADNGSNGGGSNVGIAVGATSSTSSSPEVKVRVVRRDHDQCCAIIPLPSQISILMSRYCKILCY